MVDFTSGSGWGDRSGFYLIAFSLYVLLSFGVSYPVSFLIEKSMIAVVSVCLFVYYLFSFSLDPLTRSYWDIEIVVSVM